jgi:hypothetical protein
MDYDDKEDLEQIAVEDSAPGAPSETPGVSAGLQAAQAGCETERFCCLEINR